MLRHNYWLEYAGWTRLRNPPPGSNRQFYGRFSHGLPGKFFSIGQNVRVSTLTHLTGRCLIEDDVQVGARVVIIYDNELKWRHNPELTGVILRKGSRVGSGVTLLSEVEIGQQTIIGTGSVVTGSIPAGVVAYGNPAYIQRDLLPEEYL